MIKKVYYYKIQKGVLLYSCHIVRKFLNIGTEHKSVIVYVLRQNCRAAGWWRVKLLFMFSKKIIIKLFKIAPENFQTHT
jgi:hypothetical protein